MVYENIAPQHEQQAGTSPPQESSSPTISRCCHRHSQKTITEETVVQTQGGLEVLEIEIVWLTQYAIPPMKPSHVSHLIELYCAHICDIQSFTGEALQLDLNFKFPPGIHGLIIPHQSPQLILQCDVLETVVPSLSHSNVTVHVFNYSPTPCNQNRGDKVMAMTVLQPSKANM